MTSLATNEGKHHGRRARALVRNVVLALAAVWVALVIFPSPLFAYSLRRHNVELHSRQPLSPEASAILDEAVRRLTRSPLYRADRKHDVFLCNSAGLFTFLTLKRDVTGVTNAAGNSFIRAANVSRDRVIERSGQERSGERTLTYMIAHEASHSMTMAALGRLKFFRLASFQVEGYADHLAFARSNQHPPLDLAAGREALRRQDPQMNVRQSGLYRRYELLVTYLLQRRGFTPRTLLDGPLDQQEIEGQLDADTDL